jgi:serine/threonine protein phosphatase PrpC
VRHNDIVVMATDGVFDNLYDDMITKECVVPHLSKSNDLARIQDAALCISSLAEVMGYDEKYESPFCKNAVKDGKSKRKYLGGKADDITVIVAQVKTH